MVVLEEDRDVTHTLHGKLIPGVLLLDRDFDSGYCMSGQNISDLLQINRMAVPNSMMAGNPEPRSEKRLDQKRAARI